MGPYTKIMTHQSGQGTWNFWKPGKVKEFCGTLKISWKSQGILLARNEYRRSFFKIHSSGEQELVMPVRI